MDLGTLAEAYRRYDSHASGTAQQRAPQMDEAGNIQFQDSNGQNVVINVGEHKPELPAWVMLPAFENILNPNQTRRLPGTNRGNRYSRTNVRSSLDATQARDFEQHAQVYMDLHEAQQNQTSVNEVPYEPRPQPLPANRIPRIEEANQADALTSIEMHAQIEMHRVMQRTRAEQNREMQRKGKSKGQPTQHAETQANNGTSDDGNVPTHDRTDFSSSATACAICLADFVEGEIVVRLRCGHVYHRNCHQNALNSNQTLCSICRSNRTTVAASWQYVMPVEDPPNPTQTTQSSQSTVPDQPANADSFGAGRSAEVFNIAQDEFPESFGTPEGSDSPGNHPDAQIFPWWEWRDGKCYLSVRLPDGLSIIVDPGAYTNLAGAKWVKAQAEQAKQNKHFSKQNKMKTPLGVSGVGNGSQKCTWQGHIPIAVEGEYPSGHGTCVHQFECPIVEGAGEDLPALLGLKKMSEKNAILEMTPGKECLIFPGAGGYEIKLAPGFTKGPLSRAPSGHLCIPTDRFPSSPSSGLPKQQFTLHSRVE